MTDASTDLQAFRSEARSWINDHFPSAFKSGASAATGDERPKPTEAQESWRLAMGEKGWGVPTWPRAYGGGGLNRAQAMIVQQELASAGAYNPIGGFGVIMLGPTLLEFGTEEQKLEHLPRIARGEVQWCQGYSEPGAGSDLASLQTKAEDKGDHFVINGQKIWTSGAQYSHWCFCLVRTDQTKKHEGISFVLFPMDQPGVEVRPIKMIAGYSPFCEVFLTNAIAQKKDLVGKLNGGWTIGKRLLEHERFGLSGAGERARPDAKTLPQLAAGYVGLDDDHHLADGDLRSRITACEMEGRAFTMTAARVVAESKSNSGASTLASILKNASTQWMQNKAELIVELMGNRGAGWEGGAGFDNEELAASRSMLSSKYFTIYGGSQEIQSNIISKRILGLPDNLGGK